METRNSVEGIYYPDEGTFYCQLKDRDSFSTRDFYGTIFDPKLDVLLDVDDIGNIIGIEVLGLHPTREQIEERKYEWLKPSIMQRVRQRLTLRGRKMKKENQKH